MARFKSLGSRHSRSDPSFFSIMTRLLTQSVALSTLLIIPDFVRFSRVSFNRGIKLNGTFLGGWIVGFASLLISIWYSPSTRPAPLKTS